MLEGVGRDGRPAVFLRQGSLGLQVPVELVLPDPVVLALPLRRVGAGVEEPEVHGRRCAVGAVDEQVVVSNARHAAGLSQAAGVAPVIFQLRLLVHAALVVMIAEDDGKRQLPRGDRLQDRVQRLLRAFHAPAGRRAVDLVAEEDDKIRLRRVQLRLEQRDRLLLRLVDILRIGHDEDAELPVFVKLQLPIRLRGPRRRNKGDQQHRAQRQRRQHSELFQSRSPLYL